MLSNKWTFSLTYLVMLIAFGLVCFAPSVMADGDAGATLNDVTVKISAAESMIDVDARGTDNDIQIATGRDRGGTGRVILPLSRRCACHYPLDRV